MPACLTRRGLFVGAIAAILIVVAIVTAVTLTMNQGSSSEAESTAPVVTVEQGELSGVWVDGVQGHGFKYAAFRGVPFASPPLGKLRFKGPRPPQRYKGVLNAIHEASPCVQNFAGINGTEDCLYLNVYTPRLPQKSQITRATAMPVYFFIHGGGFIWGSSTAAEFGPDFLVSRDIVVVTIQYRLGPFGYMSLDNEEMPGNAGLKDQLAALRWVHDNIASFGGDPSKVTIGGHSAGSASAHYLTLLPAAKGLFRAAILQSGTATSSWGYTTRHKEVALAVGRELAGGRQVDEQEAARLAMQATDRELYDAAIKVTDADKKSRTGVLANDIATAFSPCPERRTPRLPDGEEVLLTQDPESYIIDKLGSDVPILMGETAHEWGIFFMQQGYINDLGQVDNAVNNLISLTPSSIFPGEATKTILGITKDVTQEEIADVVDELRHHYFDLKEDGCDKACHLLKYFHEIYMKADTSHLARLRSKYSKKPTYTYVFALFSDYNQFARATNLPEYMKDAVIHGDEQGYIWRSDRVQRQDFQGTTTASRALRRQVRWWTNFIEYSDPTPPHMGRRWQPILPLSKETHLLIGDPDEFQYRDESMDGAEDPLWTKFFARFRDNRSP